MNNIWIATDWHLWNEKYDDGRHTFKSITRLGQLAEGYTSVIGTDDLFIHLGDLCDPSNTKPENLKSIIQSIPGTKILCRGNHDTEPDEYYLSAGFNHVCDILKIHDVIFSHIPVNVGVDQINIHGHLHTRKLSTLDHRYVNAYNVNYTDKPVLLEDLLQYSVIQPSSEWEDTKLDHVEEKMTEYIDIENNTKHKILDLSNEFNLEKQIVQEAVGAAIMTGFTIASGVASTNKAIGDWYKKNPITDYVIYNSSETKMYKCIDDTYKFKRTSGIAEKMIDKTFIYLKTSNNLDKSQLKRYDNAKAYWKKIKKEHKEATNENATYNKMLKENSIPTGININDLMDETSMAPILHSLSATEIEDDPLDEVIFEDPEDTIYWEQDDYKPKLYKEKEPMAETALKSEPDIYWNKDKFDSGEINLCFITGHSGSGKSTMAYNMETKNIETYELDDVNNVSAFSDDNLKEYGDLIYSYFKGPGKKYRVPYQGFIDEWFKENGFGEISSDAKYYGENVNTFISHAIKYANSHKNKKYVIEGIQLFCYCKPKDVDKYAVYIKGTSAAKSFFRSLKRDVKYEEDLKGKTQAAIWKILAAKNYARHEKMIDYWRSYFMFMQDDKDGKLKDVNESLSTYEEVTLTADHLAELHKANPELSNILPDDGKELNDPTKYYCTKVWLDEGSVVATASVRYPNANAHGYYDIQPSYIAPGYEHLTESVNQYIYENLTDSRIFNESIISTTDNIDIYDYKYEVLEEATKGVDNLQPVYVFLVNSGSMMAKMIKGVTGDDYTHASISFDPTMRIMYSFGMKQENGKGFGFAVESINNSWYKGKDMLYSIYCVFVTQAQLKKMKDRVQYFVKYGTNFLFDFPGLFLNAMNISANPQHRWFCSRFVADILNAGSSSKKNQYIKDASYMRPNDFTQTNFAHYICGGTIKNFRTSTVKAQTLKAMEQEKTERMLRGKKQMHYTVQRFQEAAAELAPLTREQMSKVNAKWDLKPIGIGDRDKYIAEEEEKLRKMREHDRKIKEMKNKNKQKLKAAKQAKQTRKLRVKNEEVHDPFHILDQERFFDWNNYENSVIGENSFTLKLVDKNFQFLNTLDEGASGHTKLDVVYVVLTHSYSAVSMLVRFATGDEYTHASIAFDSSLRTMYTFGRTADRSVFEGSFKIEDVKSDYYKDHNPPIPYSVYAVVVTEAEKKRMQKKIKYFAKNKDNFKFDFFGLIANAAKIPRNPEGKYFCSRFVSEILNAGDPKNPLVDEPSLQHPQSFAEEDFAHFVCSGDNIYLYDKSITNKVTKDILRTEKLVRAQKNKVKNENFLGINPYDPFVSNVLHYKFAMLDEAGMDNFMRYLSSFKIQFDKDGNVIISRKEFNQLDKHFRESVRMCSIYRESGNIEGIKEELAKVHYMIQLINKYYLSPNTNKNPRITSDIKKEMLDLRSVMLNHFNTYMKWITVRDPSFNFQTYYDTSKYGNTNTVPIKLLTHIGKVLITAL